MATNENNNAAPNAAGAGDFTAAGGLTTQNFEEFEQALEELFDKADDLMINQQRYDEAVSNQVFFFNDPVEIGVSANYGYGWREH